MLDAGNPFFTDVALGVESAAEEQVLTVMLCNSANRESRERAHVELLEQQRVQGVLVTPVDPHAAFLDHLAARGTPVVIVDRTRDDEAFCSVAVDDVLGGRLAVEHLLDLGHERLAFVGGPVSIGQVRDRLRGAREAWVDAGRPEEDLPSPRCASRATCSAAPPPSWSSPRPPTPTTGTSRCCSRPSWWRGPRPRVADGGR